MRVSPQVDVGHVHPGVLCLHFDTSKIRMISTRVKVGRHQIHELLLVLKRIGVYVIILHHVD
jgi:hypothetical protein